jgi:hypothetical protein
MLSMTIFVAFISQEMARLKGVLKSLTALYMQGYGILLDPVSRRLGDLVDSGNKRRKQ